MQCTTVAIGLALALAPSAATLPAPNASAAVSPGGSSSKTRVQGALDKAQIRAAVLANIDDVRHCYNEGLLRDPAMAGKVVIQFVIAPAGSVASSQVLESTLPDAHVAGCIAGALLGWIFPSPTDGGQVTVTYPFLLEPG